MRLISLSHVNDPATTNLYPGDPPSELETVATIDKDGYYLRLIRQGEHTGTHWGAPGHFNEGEPLADELDLADLHLSAVKLDVRERCARDPDYAVSIADVERWEQVHGRIPAESMVIIWTGWDGKWGTAEFTNAGVDGAPRHPGFAVETARWLIDTGRIGDRGGTGTDAFSPDVGIDATYTVSHLIYQRHRISLEILANLEALPETGAQILCGGQINRAGSGSPALIYGLLP
ncbi:cyclase family protein [Actinoplanes sp. M2I2]|uniref:cyclase family protein n=1 Tax=Actinoplanes sp. M2I2 TaxID=1734444 RepID=UPI002020C4B6|nr:cyclase family protein [Actinoplanes sp. M2I2]